MGSDYRNMISKLANEIHEISGTGISIMEVCGTHTMSIARYGIKSLLPENINIVSGPGCPVCVTSAGDIQNAIDLARDEKNIITTFGDMIKVPAQNDCLQNYKNVKIIYSPLEALNMARENPGREIILPGIGFETTAPLIAATILEARNEGLNNFSVLPMNKVIPPALDLILSDSNNRIRGLILPGHVSAVTGFEYFNFIKKYNVCGVVTGFEATDIMESILILMKNTEQNRYGVINNYERIVTPKGNVPAMKKLFEVFEISDAEWRGIGTIQG
ncbi:MAG: hydrogenase formation protein HypD, partial [Oligoflexia bacterium]|nr:hydrogenase formation protein HypD [Oligoflexia bacterium]